jgi:hypothetical protein
MTEAQILARQLDKSRELSKWYLSLMKDCDHNKTFTFEKKTFNSIIWEIGHLTMSENFLGMYLTYGPSVKISWAKEFGMGSDNTAKENYPSFSKVLVSFKSVHDSTVNHIASLTDEDLDKPTKIEFNVAGIKTVRDAVIHVIRHESIHTGHLSWLCKMHGVKSV